MIKRTSDGVRFIFFNDGESNDGESKISIIFENKYNITVKSVQSLEGDCI